MTLLEPPSDRHALIGAPTDVGASDRGASMGPEALRVAGLQPSARAAAASNVIDRGNLNGPANPLAAAGRRLPASGRSRRMEPPGARRRATPSSRAGAPADPARRRSLPAHRLDQRRRASLPRDAASKLRVLWLDAHADFNTSELSPSGNLHGMPVACLCGFGPRRADRDRRHSAGAIDPKWIRQIGIRSVDPGEKRFVHEQGLEVFDMRYIDEMGMRQTMEQALAGLDADTHLHVSFDVDFLDPDIAPGVGTTVPGGPTYREAQLCMEMIADTGRLALARRHGAQSRRSTCATRPRELAVDLIESLFGKSTLMRRG